MFQNSNNISWAIKNNYEHESVGLPDLPSTFYSPIQQSAIFSPTTNPSTSI